MDRLLAAFHGPLMWSQGVSASESVCTIYKDHARPLIAQVLPGEARVLLFRCQAGQVNSPHHYVVRC
jgi:hypothetical protein